MRLKKLFTLYSALMFVVQVAIVSYSILTVLMMFLCYPGGTLIFPSEMLPLTKNCLTVLLVLVLGQFVTSMILVPFNFNQFRLSLFASIFVVCAWMVPTALTSLFTVWLANTPIKNAFVLDHASCGRMSRRAPINTMFVKLRDERTNQEVVFVYPNNDCIGRKSNIDVAGDLQGQQVWLLGRGWALGEYYDTLQTPNGVVNLHSK